MKSLSTIQDNSFTTNALTKISILLVAAFLIFSINASAQYKSQNPTLLKLNVSPMFTGEYGIGLEHKLGKRSSIYGDVSWLNKDETQITGKGIGTKVGLRHYINLKRSYKKGRNKSKMKAFSGHFVSIEGRYGRLVPQSEALTSDITNEYSKFAVHYGMQRTWKNFFLNAEFGPSWGSSDFADINAQGYYTDGFNLDGRIAVGLAF